MSRWDKLTSFRIATTHVHRNVHAGSPRIDQLSMHFHKIPNLDGFMEANTTDIHRGTRIPTPPCGTDITRLVHPLHDRPTVDLPIDIYVGRCGEESQGDFSNPFRRSCHGYNLQAQRPGPPGPSIEPAKSFRGGSGSLLRVVRLRDMSRLSSSCGAGQMTS